MNIKELLSLSPCAVAAMAVLTSAASAPVVENVTIAQDRSSRLVTVTYTIDAPAVVTMDITTNGVSIGGANLWYQSGDVNRLVSDPSGTKTIRWRPDKAWPGNITENGVEVKAVVTAWATNAPPDYMVVDLSGSGNVAYYASAEAVPFGVTNYLYKTSHLVMRKIPAAEVVWTMGSPTTELGRYAPRETPHKVVLSSDYYIGIYEVTMGQWRTVRGDSYPAPDSGVRNYFASVTNGPVSTYATRPMAYARYNDEIRNTSWPARGKGDVDSGKFLGKATAATGVTFDLPTAAEWEFACRAGSGMGLYATADDPGRDITDTTADEYLGTLGFYKENKSDSNEPVGQKKPNVWGLYDMLGNVYEVVLDWYAEGTPLTDTFDAEGITRDPAGPETDPKHNGNTNLRTVRGGATNSGASYLRCAANANQFVWQSFATSGFRLWAPAEAK